MNYQEVCSELYEVLSAIGTKYINRTPASIINEIESNRNKRSVIEYDINKSLDEQDVSNETITIISFLNYMYWTNDQEKKGLYNAYKLNELKSNKKIVNKIIKLTE